MEIKRYEGTGRMSKAVTFGDTLYLCGQVGKTENTIEAQTAEVLGKIEDLLNLYGSSKRHILSATLYIKSMSLFGQMNSVWDSWVENGFEPARTCVEASMANESILIEITVTAALK